nr:DUF3330 domain-containing protein [Roseateles puraquae]
MGYSGRGAGCVVWPVATPEGAEYVEHFCGLEGYQCFKARINAEVGTDTEPTAS